MEDNKRKWIMTDTVYDEIRRTIGCHYPEQGGILGSSDGVHIDHYYFDSTAQRTSATYTMDAASLNEVIHDWNDHDIRLIGVIHSHPTGCTAPSYGDRQIAEHIIETIDVDEELFTPIVQVSDVPDGNITIYPYSFRKRVALEEDGFAVDRSAAAHPVHEPSESGAEIFARLQNILPYDVTFRKKVICVGCGGSTHFLETLARCGIGRFVLLDGDRFEKVNIATQGAYLGDVGKYKADVIRERILQIHPDAEVTAVKCFLNDTLTDEAFAFLTGIQNDMPKDVLLCGCTDDFYAQDRCAKLAMRFGVPYLAAQIFAGGTGHEVLFWVPGLTEACPGCMLSTRYKKVLAGDAKQKGESAGTPPYITDHLNAVKADFALKILCGGEENTKYFRSLEKYADRNYIMTTFEGAVAAPTFAPLYATEKTEPDLTYPTATVAIGQEKEADCMICAENRVGANV